MAGKFSRAILVGLLDHIFRPVPFTPSLEIFVSLHTADPGDTGVNEISYTGYGVRPKVVFDPAVNREITQNTTAVVFPTCTADPTPASHYGLWTAATEGVYLGSGILIDNLAIQVATSPKIFGGNISVGVTAGIGTDGGVGFTTYLANKLLDFVFRNQAFIRPSISLALTTSPSTDTTFGTECVGGDYARATANTWSPAALIADGAEIYNSAQVSFLPNPSASWGEIVSVSYFDEVGNRLFYGNDVVNQVVSIGDIVSFLENALAVELK